MYRLEHSDLNTKDVLLYDKSLSVNAYRSLTFLSSLDVDLEPGLGMSGIVAIGLLSELP